MTLDRDQLTALKERVEKATGPDRELDRDIMLALLPSEYRIEDDEGRVARKYECGWSVPGHGYDPLMSVPKLTASLDASIALVERMLPNWGWWMQTYAAGDVEASVLEPLPDPFKERPRSYISDAGGMARTAPLAILTALLNALSRMSEEGQ